MERQVERERAEAWARDHGMLFLEASAKTRLGIKQVFMEVVQKILENPEALASAVPGKPKLQINWLVVSMSFTKQSKESNWPSAFKQVSSPRLKSQTYDTMWHKRRKQAYTL